MKYLPRPIFDTVAAELNCEDIAMSFMVSSLTGGQSPRIADFWIRKSMVKLYSVSGISGTSSHKKVRDECVDRFSTILGLKPDGPNPLSKAQYMIKDQPANCTRGVTAESSKAVEQMTAGN